MNIFVPLMRNPLPSGSALVRRAKASEPEPGSHSVHPDPIIASADTNALLFYKKLVRVSEAKPAGNNIPLHLGGAGINGTPHGIAQSAFDLVLRHVAVSAIDLHGIQGSFDK